MPIRPITITLYEELFKLPIFQDKVKKREKDEGSGRSVK